MCDGVPHWCPVSHRPKESPTSNTKPVSVLQNSRAEENNSPQVEETNQKGASVQEVKQNVPSGSRAIVLLQHNTNEGSGSKNEEQMRGSTIPPSEHTIKVNILAELAVPQARKEHLIEVQASDPSKSKIRTCQSDDINPSLETDKEKPIEIKEYLGTGKDQQDEVKRSLYQAKDKPDHVSGPLGTSKDQTDDGRRCLEIAEKLGDNIERSLEADLEQPDDVNVKDQPGNVNKCLGTAKDQPDYVKRSKPQLQSTSRSLRTVKEEPKEIKRSSGDAKKQPDDANSCSELVKDQPDDAKRAAIKQVDHVQRPLGAVIEQPDDFSVSTGPARELLGEVKGFTPLCKEQPHDVTRALETGKEDLAITRTLAAKEQSDEVKVGSCENMSPGISVVAPPVPSPQHETSPDSLTETTEEPSVLSEESFLLEKIRQMAEDTDTSPLSVPDPVPDPPSRPRKCLVPSVSDFDLPSTPPLQHRVCSTSPEHADQCKRPVFEVTSEDPTVDPAELHAEGAELLEDERTLNSKANDETLEKENVPSDRVSAEDELNEAQREAKPAPVLDLL